MVGVTRENDRARLGLQRLDQLDVQMVSARTSKWRDQLAPKENLAFEIEWVTSSDGVQIPVSRFYDPVEPRSRSLVTVHGGFGLSLRPLSGMPSSAGTGDIVYCPRARRRGTRDGVGRCRPWDTEAECAHGPLRGPPIRGR